LGPQRLDPPRDRRLLCGQRCRHLPPARHEPFGQPLARAGAAHDQSVPRDPDGKAGVARLNITADATGDVADVAAGIRAILNYAPVVIQVPENVWVRHIDPVAVLHSMTYYLARQEDRES